MRGVAAQSEKSIGRIEARILGIDCYFARAGVRISEFSRAEILHSGILVQDPGAEGPNQRGFRLVLRIDKIIGADAQDALGEENLQPS